jgi:dTMP kinase
VIGKLITIEGIDGSGKHTQAEKLVARLTERSIKAKLYNFPCYTETFFGKEIGCYLRGEFGSIDQVHPKLASLLFAGDRFEKKNSILDDIAKGIYVVCDRYVESNMAHQCAKLPAQERVDFIQWIEYLEYDIFKMPKPDITVFLDVPLNISKELVLKKAQRSYTEEKEDIHERAHGYLEEVYNIYKCLQKEKQWMVIDCVEANEIRHPSAISDDLMKIV